MILSFKIILFLSLFLTFIGCGSDGSSNINSDYNITITSSANSNGIILPFGVLDINLGSDQSYSIYPNVDYYIWDVYVDGISVGATSNYLFENITNSHTIEVFFSKEHLYVTLGDSITFGYGDDIPNDDESYDGKNVGGGYQPILNDLLTVYKNGFPFDIVNEGIDGTTSADGVLTIESLLIQYPEAKLFIVQYGTNDSNPMLQVPSGKGLNVGDYGYAGSFKDNLQRIVSAVKDAGKEICIAKPPIVVHYADPDLDPRNILLREYSEVIDELVYYPTNTIAIEPPDFYNYFREIDPITNKPRYYDQYIDGLHLNGKGYQSMAKLWFNALIN